MKLKFYLYATIAMIIAMVFSGCEKPEKTWLNEGSVTTGVASNVTTNTATLEGAVYPLDVEVTEMGFYYDTTREMYSLQKVVATDGFLSVATGLAANTTYYYCAYATAYGRTKEGDTKMFKTEEIDTTKLVIDFETGDFTQARFSYTSDYPWEVTRTNPYQGLYCMKSTNEYRNSSTSYIELTVNNNSEKIISFYVKVSSESKFDKFVFYIDNEAKSGQMSGDVSYRLLEYTIPQGSHTLKWEYKKDSSGQDGEDCAYVDNIVIK